MQLLQLKSGGEVEFKIAQDIASSEADKNIEDPMLLAWKDRRTGKHSPDVDCCCEDGKESWEIYAESRGGTVRVEIGDQYIFIFREGLKSG